MLIPVGRAASSKQSTEACFTRVAVNVSLANENYCEVNEFKHLLT